MLTEVKHNSTKKLNGKTPDWFREWHDTEFAGMSLKVQGLLWLIGVLAISGLACFGIMLAGYLMPS